MSQTIKIGANDITTYYKAKVLADSVEISGTPVTNYYTQGINRTNYIFFRGVYGLKSIKFRVCFEETTRTLAESYKTVLLGALLTPVEVTMPDDFIYRSVLSKAGKEEWQGVDNKGVLLFVDIELVGIQHKAKVTVADGRTIFSVNATFPKMDAKLTAIVGSSASSYTLGGATFGAVTAGDVLVFDGIEKRILKNGSPATATGFYEFPYVKPGNNVFAGLDAIQVEYYPCYV